MAGFGDIPFTHGDISMVSYQLYQVKPSKTYFSTYSFFLGSFAFLPMGAFYCLLQVSKDARFFLVRSIISDSLLMRKHNPSGVFVEAITLISIYTAVFHFQLFQKRTNTVADISNWSVRIQRYWKNVSRIILRTRQPFTKVKPACRQSIMMHVLTSVACIAFSLNV